MPQISKEQAEFMPSRGTREHILNTRQITENTQGYELELYMRWIDFSKVFDIVKWSKLWQILRVIGAPECIIRIIGNLYESNMSTIRVNNCKLQTFKLEAGVRQDCIISPMLFNTHSEHRIREVLDGWKGGITIAGRKINNLRHADDVVLLVALERKLQDIMKKLKVNITILN